MLMGYDSRWHRVSGLASYRLKLVAFIVGRGVCYIEGSANSLPESTQVAHPETRAQNVEQSSPHNIRRFGADITIMERWTEEERVERVTSAGRHRLVSRQSRGDWSPFLGIWRV